MGVWLGKWIEEYLAVPAAAAPPPEQTLAPSQLIADMLGTGALDDLLQSGTVPVRGSHGGVYQIGTGGVFKEGLGGLCIQIDDERCIPPEAYTPERTEWFLGVALARILLASTDERAFLALAGYNVEAFSHARKYLEAEAASVQAA